MVAIETTESLRAQVKQPQKFDSVTTEKWHALYRQNWVASDRHGEIGWT